MTKIAFLTASAFLLLTKAFALDVRLLANNKEIVSRHITDEDIHAVSLWTASHPMAGLLKANALKALSETLNKMQQSESTCEIGLARELKSNADRFLVTQSDEDFFLFLKMLRVESLIDDIFYKILFESASLYTSFESDSENSAPARPWNLNTRHNAGMDLKKYFKPMQGWPDEVRNCSVDIFFEMVASLRWKSSKERDSQLIRLHYLGLLDGHINLTTFNRLEILRKKQALDWPVYFKRYRDIIQNAKDKLAKIPEAKPENEFSVKYVSRKNKITNRTYLYQNYNSTQVMMLSEVIEKVARRIDATQAYLRWQYSDDPEDHEIYVLSPMEQYRAAINMLRKDIAELSRSRSFSRNSLQYEHLIAAAYEAGFIKSSELDEIVKFEDLWNPKIPNWKRYAGFAFNLVGSAAFYLPPPFNLLGAIGLVLVESRVMNKDNIPDPENNWNVIL